MRRCKFQFTEYRMCMCEIVKKESTECKLVPVGLFVHALGTESYYLILDN